MPYNTITTTTTPDAAAPFVALEQPAVEALARILYLSRATMASAPPKMEAACQRWLRRQKRQIANLEEMSLRRPRTLSLLGDVLFRGGALARRPQETLEAEGTAALCTSHRRLDPRVMTALMALVAEEVTVWAESGKGERWDERKRRGGAGVEEEAAAAEVWRKSIVKIAVLWMGRRRWEDEMGRSIGELEVPPCARYRGCCAACKLAVVGGSVQFLMDLRTSLLARRELARGLQDDDDDEPPPPLLRMVEAWIDVCYTRRRRRFMRTESDMMVNLLVRLQTSGGGGGGGSGRKVSGGHGGGEQTRRYTQRAWPMPVVKVEVGELIRSGGDDDDDDTKEEEEYGRGGATRWRRRKRMSKEEGYSQYLPASLRAVPEPWTTVRGGGTATHNAKRANADYCQAPPAPARPEYASSPRRRPTPPPPPPPPSSPPVEPPWVTPDYDPPAAEPWHAGYGRSVCRQSTYSFWSSSATLSAIYDAYTAARSTTTTMTTTTSSLCAPSPILTQRRTAAEMPSSSGAVSPPSPSVYSSVQHKTGWNAAAAAAATTPRWGACARAMRPPLPLQQRRLLSEITARPPPLVIVRDPIQSVTRLVSSTF
ncbi:hypothetical protein MY10362_005161 [Beauveria mimosiformis]